MYTKIISAAVANLLLFTAFAAAQTMPADADPLEQLAPAIPLVAGHPAPVTPASLMAGEPLASSSVVAGISPEIVLAFAPAAPHTVPLLSALASLRVR